MKSLKIPLLPALDVLDISSVGYVLENQSRREFINVVNWEEYPYIPIAVVDIGRTDRNLYLRFLVRSNSLKAAYYIDGSPVYEDSCVEFFMQIPGNSFYMTFEFNCIGVCDGAFRKSRSVKVPLSPDEYASIRRHSSLEFKPFKEKTGEFSWELIVAIPLSLLGLDTKKLPEKIRGNFYKCADKTISPHFLSWSPIDLPKPDFHCPQFFGDLYL